MSFWDQLDPQYRVILCDIWGVVHDGVRLYPHAAERLRQWKEEGRTVILITNAPRPADAVEEQLARMGLPSDCWDAITTSGEAGITALAELERPLGFIGTEGDRAVLEGRGIRIDDDQDFTDLACTGVTENRPLPEQYGGQLQQLASRGVTFHCLNPDRVVVRGGVPEACAGALADLFEEMGGAVRWYGKPFPAIYDHALRAAGTADRSAVLAIGDGLQTDMAGAARAGLDAVFVAGGIQRGEAFPDDFGDRFGTGAWRPLAVVDGLA